MTDIETLRKALAELRDRVERLERAAVPIGTVRPTWPPAPAPYSKDMKGGGA